MTDINKKKVDVSDDEISEEPEELFEREMIVCAKGQEPLRIDKFLMGRIEGATRSKIQQGIEAERVLVNDQAVKSNYKVRPLDKIVIYQDYLPDSNEIVPENIPFKIVYEDEDVMVIDKEPGMVVHPGSGNPGGTLVNAVAFHLKQQNPEIEETELSRFGLVHRIDKNTSGLLVMAKNPKAMTHLAKQFFDHTVHRRYVALVWGDFEENEGTIVAHVGRHQRFRKLFTAYPEGEHGKDAITHYKVLERLNYVSLVECRLETGRTHQIRVHLAFIGHPIVGDELYNRYTGPYGGKEAISKRQFLHAARLAFRLPDGQGVEFEAPIPADLVKALDRARLAAK
jgi:23S rRNA pseudouridine1911/1915/1917 synthase